MMIEFIENVISLPNDNPLGCKKEINVVRCDGQFFYLFGNFDANHDLIKEGMFLNETEFRLLIHQIYLLKDKECELDKFKKDYIQQSHNGSQLERERNLV